jgi:putative resolvase
MLKKILVIILMNNEQRWVPIREACEFYGKSPGTLRAWGDKGIIECKRTPTGQRVFNIRPNDVYGNKLPTKKAYIYVRVSSKKQENDLVRQLLFLQNKYPEHFIVKDIGSGLNYKRKGFLKLIDEVGEGKVSEVVVFSKDRLCRFGFELVEHIFNKNNTKLVVHEQIDKSPEEEFTEDILAIL